MSLEDNVRLIVEQVINQMAVQQNKTVPPKKNHVHGVVEQRSPSKSVTVENMEGALSDITAVDMQKQLNVPEPVDAELYKDMKLNTPARIGVWRSGTRPLTETMLRFRADHATAQDAVLNDVSEEFVQKMELPKLQTACRDKDEFLTRPDLGRKLSADSLELLRKQGKKGCDVQFIIVDGLSSTAVEANVPDIYQALVQGLKSLNVTDIGAPFFVKYGRVAIMDVIGEELKPKVAIVLIGERPGLGTAESLSAYLAYNPRQGMVESERTVFSNIHKGGTPAVEAGAHIAGIIKTVLERKVSGVELNS
ncbi:MAG: ethanolamine ammonia-lyase subunit EutC [Thermincolia bacterium]